MTNCQKTKPTGRWIPVANRPGVYVRHKLRPNGERCPADVAKGEDVGRCRCEPSYRAQRWDPALKRPVQSKVYGDASEAAGWLADKARGIVVRDERAKGDDNGLTVAALLDAFLAAAEAGTALTHKKKRFRAGTLDTYRSSLDLHVRPKYGSKPATAMDAVAWQNVVAELLAKPSARSAKRDAGATLGGQAVASILNPVRAAYRWGAQPNVRLVPANPMRDLDMPERSKTGKKRVVTKDQAMRMLAALPTGARVIWALMFYCGLRVSEARALDWTDLDFRRHLVTVPKSKSDAGEGREVPMPKPLREILLAWRGDVGRIGPLVPGERIDRISYEGVVNPANAAWTVIPASRSLEGVSTPRLTPHEARHTYASWLIASHHDLAEIMSYMGHANLAVTAQYVKTLPGFEKSSRGRLDDYFAQAS